MITLRLFLLPVICGLLATGCSMHNEEPQEVDLGPADISLDVLQKKMKNATDPKRLFRNADSYVMQQLLVTGNEDDKDMFMIITRYQKPNKLSITKLENGLPVAGQLIKDDKAWLIDYKARKSTPLEGKQLKLARTMFEISNPSATFSKIFPEIKLEQCRIDSRFYYKMICRSGEKGANPLNLYVGKNNFLVKQVSFIRKADGMHYDAVMDQYGLYEGVMIAKKLTVKMNNLTQLYKVVKYKLNPKLSLKDFELPDFSKPE